MRPPPPPALPPGPPEAWIEAPPASVRHVMKTLPPDPATAPLPKRHPREPRHVLSKIEDVDTGQRLAQGLRREFLLPSDRRAWTRHQQGGRSAEKDDRLPFRIVESGLAPAGHLASRIVGFPVVEVRFVNRPGGALPLPVSRNDGAGAVRMLHLELHEQRETPAVPETPAKSADAAGIPAVAQHRAQDVLAFAKEAGDIVGRDLQPPAIVGPPRREEVLPDAAPVEMKLEDAASRHVCACTQNGLVEPEDAAQERTGTFGPVGLAADPAGLPVARLEQPHFEGCGFAPIREMVPGIPDTYPPEDASARRQRRTAPGDAGAVAADYPPGVPKIRCRRKQFRTAGGNNLEGSLPGAPARVVHFPR